MAYICYQGCSKLKYFSTLYATSQSWTSPHTVSRSWQICDVISLACWGPWVHPCQKQPWQAALPWEWRKQEHQIYVDTKIYSIKICLFWLLPMELSMKPNCCQYFNCFSNRMFRIHLLKYMVKNYIRQKTPKVIFTPFTAKRSTSRYNDNNLKKCKNHSVYKMKIT